MVAAGTSCNCTTPPMIKHTSLGFHCVCLYMACASVWVCVCARECMCVSYSFVSSHGSPHRFVHFHGNLMLQGLQQIWMCLCMLVSGRGGDRKRNGEGGQERERVIEWTVHYHGQLYWIKMADGGWEHIRGAYIIQHLIEGAGWKRSRVEKEREDPWVGGGGGDLKEE